MIKLRLSLFLFFTGIIALLLYSFTQVDLSLTLSKSSIFQFIEKQFQHIGFYERPVSALIFSAILILLFLTYILFLNISRKNNLRIKYILICVIFATGVLIFSYNAFSYDLFNYIFDAKIVTTYHQNPYFFKPIDFAGDPILNFMRWTHRTFPYGPGWLVITVPLSFLGMGLFVPTFFLFKLLMGISFLGSTYLIYKISEIVFPQNKIFNTIFFAFNPLVIIETLVSAHNDIPMIFLLLLSIYLYLQKKKVLSFFINIFSISIKFSTGVLFPLFLLLEYHEKTRKQINWEKFFIAATLFSLLTVVFASIRTNFQPWYLIFPLSIAAFVSNKKYIFLPALIATFISVIIYIPYVYMTDYAKEYPGFIKNIETTGIIIFCLVLGFFIAREVLIKNIDKAK